ncbi:hypothetical protein M432DRAFT_591781 [Thermoascus aurantiacus ATCC 26904]
MGLANHLEVGILIIQVALFKRVLSFNILLLAIYYLNLRDFERTLLRLPSTLISTMKLRAAQRLAENRKEGYMDDSIHRNLVFICRYMDNEGKLHKVWYTWCHLGWKSEIKLEMEEGCGWKKVTDS